MSWTTYARTSSSPTPLRAPARSSTSSPLLVQAHSVTWFSTQGLPQPASSEAGSKAGDPLGDALFTVVMTRVLEQCVSNLRIQDLLIEIAWDPSLPAISAPSDDHLPVMTELADCSYVDDGLFFVEASTPHLVVKKTAAAAGVIVDTITSFGLKPNLNAGKTEAMFHLVGPGAKDAKQLLHRQGGVHFNSNTWVLKLSVPP